MAKYLIVFAAFLLAAPAIAGNLPDTAIGTYVILDQNRVPTDMFYRLSQKDGKWNMEGKNPGGNWENISCDSGCEYRKTSEAEIQSYFPADWIANAKMSCIQNTVQAFCRYNSKKESSKGGYVVVAFVTGRPTPIFLRRVKP